MIDFILLKNVSNRENSKKLRQHQRIQDRKLFHLCAKRDNKSSMEPDTVVFNFSNRLITEQEKEILSKGLNFALPPTKLNTCNFCDTWEVEKFYNLLKQEPLNEHSGFFPDSIKSKLKDNTLSGLRSYGRPNFL